MRQQYFVALSFLFLSSTALAQNVIINEVMQSNVDCIMDDKNEFPDSWVELYNNGPQTTYLSNYYLGTERDGSNQWKLPVEQIGPYQTAIIYCDKEDSGKHAPFRLDSGKGCGVYLFESNGTTIADSIFIEQKQPAPNISYGRLNETSSQWGYQYTPTPLAKNCGELCDQLLDEPIFSEHGQVFGTGTTIQLTLTIPDSSPADAQIRYTTDGSEPTRESMLYSAPISISSSRVIRAKLFHPGWLSPRSTTQSYLMLGREMTLPVISIVTDRKYFYDNKVGIYVDGSYSYSKKNYKYDWRRPINFELFTAPESSSTLNQLCETRVSGAASRGCSLKSLAVYAHKRFGEKHFKYEFFPDQRPDQKKFRSLVLRNAGNDFDYLYMRDAICQRTMAEHSDLDWQAWRPAIVYINGTYKGILNIRERANDNNVYTNYDGLEDIDLIENWTSLKTGTMDLWNEFYDFYNEHGHTWDEYNERMDLDEFLNLMIMNLYFNNLDFPGNNFVSWRPREEGGRWRFIAKDVDYTMGLYGLSSDYKVFEWLNNPNYDSGHGWANHSDHTRLFRRLMEDEDFARAFVERFAIYMGDFLNLDGVWEVWEPMYDIIKTEYPNHRKLINEWWPNYSSEVSTAKNWLRYRTSNLYTQLQNYYEPGQATSLVFSTAIPNEELSDINVTFNGVPLSKARFNGKFFAGHEVTLQASPAIDQNGNSSGRTITSWQLVRDGQTQDISGSVCHFTMSSGSTTIIAVAGEAALESVQEDPSDAQDALIYDLNGRCLGADASVLPAGFYIQGGKKFRL